MTASSAATPGESPARSREKMFRLEGNRCRAYAKRKLPILSWSRTYEFAWLAQDALAGLTVGLTAVPQGIAYAVVAELSPEVRISTPNPRIPLLPRGNVISLVSSRPVRTVRVLHGLVRLHRVRLLRQHHRRADRHHGDDGQAAGDRLRAGRGRAARLPQGLHHRDARVAASGLHLGFRLAARDNRIHGGRCHQHRRLAVQAAAGHSRPQRGPARLCDLGVLEPREDPVPGHVAGRGDHRGPGAAQGAYARLENRGRSSGDGGRVFALKNLPGRRTGTWPQRIGWTVTLGRNALVVVAGIVLAYAFHGAGSQPFTLTGSMGNGLPPLGPPPFSLQADNRTLDFLETSAAMGTTLFSVPIVSTIEHVAIAKAFAMGRSLDVTQEMFALGLCNVFGSFVRSMPVTGSFTRTAVNRSSGVKTTLGGLFTGCLVLLASSLLTSAFRFIPKATLAGVIVCAMYYMLDFRAYALLWRAKKIDFLLMLVTLLFCVFLKLEWGIVIGTVLNLLPLLYHAARPVVTAEREQLENGNAIRVTPEESVAFPAAENFRAHVMELCEGDSTDVTLDCRNLKRIDVTVAKNLKLLANDLRLRGQTMVCVNCPKNVEVVLKTVAPNL